MQVIPTEVTALARLRLTEAEITKVVRTAAARAAGLPGWAPGKNYRVNFTKGGKDFTVAIDFRPDGYQAFIGLLQEVTLDG